MKQSPSNPGDPSSASSAGENPCFSGGPNIAALNVLADGSVSYLLPYAQFLFAERESNPALEKEPDAPPEKLLICFAQADVVVLGSDLKRFTEGGFPALVMTKEMVANALGVAPHNIPPLSRAGLIKALGRPDRYCVKHYSRDALARNLADPGWLEKAMAAFHRHWRIKNARKRATQKDPA